MAARGKLHKSIVSSPVFPILSLGNAVPPVLHVTSGIVLKMFNVLVEDVRVKTLHQMNPQMMKVIKSGEKK